MNKLNEAISNKKIGVYFCECGESYVSDVAYEYAACLLCSRDIKRIDSITEKQYETLAIGQIEHINKIV